MPKITITVDTDTEDSNVNINGRDIANVNYVNIYRYDSMENPGKKILCSTITVEEVVEDGIRQFTQITAKDKTKTQEISKSLAKLLNPRN